MKPRGYALILIMGIITSLALLVVAGLPPFMAEAESIDRDFARQQLRELRSGALAIAAERDENTTLRWDRLDPNSPRSGFLVASEGPAITIVAYAESVRERCTQRTTAVRGKPPLAIESMDTEAPECARR